MLKYTHTTDKITKFTDINILDRLEAWVEWINNITHCIHASDRDGQSFVMEIKISFVISRLKHMLPIDEMNTTLLKQLLHSLKRRLFEVDLIFVCKMYCLCLHESKLKSLRACGSINFLNFVTLSNLRGLC